MKNGLLILLLAAVFLLAACHEPATTKDEKTTTAAAEVKQNPVAEQTEKATEVVVAKKDVAAEIEKKTEANDCGIVPLEPAENVKFDAYNCFCNAIYNCKPGSIKVTDDSGNVFLHKIIEQRGNACTFSFMIVNGSDALMQYSGLEAVCADDFLNETPPTNEFCAESINIFTNEVIEVLSNEKDTSCKGALKDAILRNTVSVSAVG